MAATLSAVAYLGAGGDHADQYRIMSDALKITDLPTRSWKIVWGPCEGHKLLMFAAEGLSSGKRKEYAVVIRGSVASAWNIFVDLDTRHQVDLIWKAP